MLDGRERSVMGRRRSGGSIARWDMGFQVRAEGNANGLGRIPSGFRLGLSLSTGGLWFHCGCLVGHNSGILHCTEAVMIMQERESASS